MNIKYKIVEIHPQDHLIVVRYYSDEFPEKDLASAPELNEDGTPVRCRTDVAISVPIPEPSEEELNKLISRNCPVVFFETQQKIKDPNINTSMSLVKTKLKVETPVVIESAVQPQILTDSDIQALLEKL